MLNESAPILSHPDCGHCGSVKAALRIPTREHLNTCPCWCHKGPAEHDAAVDKLLAKRRGLTRKKAR